MTPYDALHSSAAWFDLSSRGRIRATGEDRARLLHAMTTNHVQDLQPGSNLYAFFLNAQGRILADAIIFCAEDQLLVDVEPEVREKIYQHLDRYIIADDVTLEDVTEHTCEFAIEGPAASGVLETLGAPSYTHILQAGATGAPGYRLIAPAASRSTLVASLRAAAPEASPSDVEAVRLENGQPRYGVDFTEAHLAQETGLMHALHFNKGCYLGQEIVERVRSRGHVNKSLAHLEIDPNSPSAPGSKVMSGDKPAGEITSAAATPAGRTFALAWLRAEFLKSPFPLTVDGAPAHLIPRPPVK
jgi:aminomethyltransferase